MCVQYPGVSKKIVLLRQSVRRARICVINKLVREAKRLRTNRGNEKLSEKNKNKAEKCLKEVFELKRIKDDEVSKFGIINFENLQHILQNSETDDRTRVTVKVVRYKCLNDKIVEFLKKFPNCKEYISLSEKNHLLKKRRKNSISKYEQKDSKRLSNKKDDNSDGNIRINLNIKKDGQDVDVEESSVKNNEKSSMFVSKAVSKEATVKRFADIVEESDTLRVDDKCEENKEHQHRSMSLTVPRLDDFFLCSDKTAARINTGILSPKEDLNITPRINRIASKTIDKRSVKRDNSTYGGSERKQSDKRQRVNGKNVLYHINNVKETNRAITKKKQGFPGSKEAPADEKFIQTKSLKNESLHPSWEARRKLQDTMKQGFQGKKIRFEET
ncbi:serum response factor-binding protein 1 isoform X2 [Augochlora pura]